MEHYNLMSDYLARIIRVIELSAPAGDGKKGNSYTLKLIHL